MLEAYTPELGEKKPEGLEFEAQLSYNGKHYFVKAKVKITVKRGVEFIKTYQSKDLTPQAQHRVGWHEYQMTRNAFNEFKKLYRIGYELLLD